MTDHTYWYTGKYNRFLQEQNEWNSECDLVAVFVVEGHVGLQMDYFYNLTDWLNLPMKSDIT